MREVIVTGKTVEDATEKGCQELSLTRDEVSVEILEMPIQKFFRRIPAKVKVTAIEQEPVQKPVKKQEKPEQVKTAPKKEVKTQPAPKPVAPKKATVLEQEPESPIDIDSHIAVKRAVEYLAGIFDTMGAAGTYQINAVQQGDATLLRIEGEEFENWIEVNGDVVQSLSYLTDRAANKGIDKKDPEYIRVRLDIAGYRNRRETELTELANRTGEQVARTKRSRTLAPMNSYERLIIHTAISNMEGLVSESIGADVERRVVIKSTAPDATDGDDWSRPNKNGRRGNSRGGNNNRRRPNSNKDRRDSAPRSNTPQREYANKPHNPDAAPIVPERREAIRDGEDLPLYGKIDI